MRKIKIAMIALVLGIAAQSAQAQFSLGAGLGYATEIKSLGISAHAGYQFDDNWAATASYTYLLEKEHVTWSLLDFNANYSFYEVGSVGSLYGLAGLNILMWNMDDYELLGQKIKGANESEFGFNLGAGFKIDLSESLSLSPELTYTFSDSNYFRIGAKIMFAL